jgi:hypothetical protein
MIKIATMSLLPTLPVVLISTPPLSDISHAYNPLVVSVEASWSVVPTAAVRSGSIPLRPRGRVYHQPRRLDITSARTTLAIV